MPIQASKIAAVFLTHAHMDHCGLLPWLVRNGFKGKVWCTRPTANVTRISLMDRAGHDDADFEREDVERIDFCAVDDQAGFGFGRYISVQEGLTFSVFRTAHIMGSVGFEFQFTNGEKDKRTTLVFSGDLGNNSDDHCVNPLLNTRQYPSTHAEYVVCESTYGNRLREPDHSDPVKRHRALAGALIEAASSGDSPLVIIPSFTLQRMQDILIDLHDVLSQADDADWQVGRVEVICDSKLAEAYAEVFVEQLQRKRENGKPYWLHPDFESQRCEGGKVLEEVLKEAFGHSGFSFALENSPRPEATLKIVLAGSGMCHQGKVVDLLKCFLRYEQVTVLLTGYQSPGLPGGKLMKMARNPGTKEGFPDWDIGADEVQARVVDLSPYYSGHADQRGLLDFMLKMDTDKPFRAIKRVFLNHGEGEAREALKEEILKKQGKRRHRKVEAVELPQPGSGWFDLFDNRWTEAFDPGIDDMSLQLATLQRRLERIEALLAKAGLGGHADAVLPALNEWKDVSRIDLLKCDETGPVLEMASAGGNKA